MCKEVTKKLKEHYEAIFSTNGPSARGVDWGSDEAKLHLRYAKMLAVIQEDCRAVPSLLDVGCGFGGLLGYARSRGIVLDYTGIDVAENMIDWARSSFKNAQFICGDFLECKFSRKFDYVVCNGILTQKLDIPGIVMDQFAAKLIRKMYSLCERGIAFNVMTTKVNFFSNNLYYRSPVELLAWCLNEITPYFRVDHAYPLFEYTVYLYRCPDSVRDWRKTP